MEKILFHSKKLIMKKLLIISAISFLATTSCTHNTHVAEAAEKKDSMSVSGVPSYLLDGETIEQDNVPKSLKDWQDAGITIDHLAYSIHAKGKYIANGQDGSGGALAGTRYYELEKFSNAVSLSRKLMNDPKVAKMIGMKGLTVRNSLIADAMTVVSDSLPTKSLQTKK